MEIREIAKYGMTALASDVLSYYASQWIHTPRSASIIDYNSDKIEDVVVFSRDKKIAVIYGISPPEQEIKEFIPGEDLSKRLNRKWRREYEKNGGERPDYEKFGLRTRWR